MNEIDDILNSVAEETYNDVCKEISNTLKELKLLLDEKSYAIVEGKFKKEFALK